MSDENSYRKHRVPRYDGPDLYKIIHPHFLNYHKMTVDKDFEYPDHTHSSYELIWVERGPYLCRLNEAELKVNRETILIVKPGDSHQDHLRQGQSHYVLHFTLDQPLFSDSAEPILQMGEMPAGSASRIFREIEAESASVNQPDRFAGTLQDALFETLFWRIVRRLPESALSETFSHDSQRQEFATRLYRLFHHYRDRSLPVESMAETMGLSSRNLSLKCQKYYGDSPAKLFLKYKMQHARNLLNGGNRSIKEISYELGFDSPYNFSRAFKRVTGVSPSEFRDVHQ